MTISKVGVIGAGTMGIGIVELLIKNGYSVDLFDVSDEKIDEGLVKLSRRLSKDNPEYSALDRINILSSLDKFDNNDFIIEAVFENLELKQSIFEKLDRVTKSDCILASNTSSYLITSIGKRVLNKKRLLGLHFFNPVVKMLLVEVIKTSDSCDEYIGDVYNLMKVLGKEPIVAKDSPGFIVNRIARAFHLESYRLVGENMAYSKEQVDKVMRSAGFRMGPFELQDLIGIDINFFASESIYENFFYEPRFRLHFEQKLMLEKGHLGRKTGKGHYTYE